MKEMILQSGVRVVFKLDEGECNQATFFNGPMTSVAFKGDSGSRLVIYADDYAALMFAAFYVEMTAQEAIDVVKVMTGELGFTFTKKDMRKE